MYALYRCVFFANFKVAACKTVEWESIEKFTEKLDEEQGQSATQATGTSVLFDVCISFILCQ